MRYFLVNLLPSDVRVRAESRGERRRFGLLLALLLISLLGVSLHSWDQARRARLVRDAAVVSRDRLDDVDGELARLESERSRLAAFMDAYRSVALPMELSDLLATIVNAMPIPSTLTDISVRLDQRPVADAGAPAAAPAPGAPPSAPPKMRRLLEIRIRGYAAGNGEVTAYERALAALPVLERVTLGENRSMETPEGNFQEFVITAEVPLDRAFGLGFGLEPLAFDAPRKAREFAP